MKKSLSNRLMYSYMGLIAIIIIGISVGLSYLITDYFFRQKALDLQENGTSVAATSVNYLEEDNLDGLNRYLSAVDQMIGARIWLYDKKYTLLSASKFTEKLEEEEDTSPLEQRESEQTGQQEAVVSQRRAEHAEKDLKLNAAYDKVGGKVVSRDADVDLKIIEARKQAKRNSNARKAVESIARRIKEANSSEQVHNLLQQVYEGKVVNARVFHPYYQEQVILVGMPAAGKEGENPKIGAVLIAAPIAGLDRVVREIYLYTFFVGFVALIISLIIGAQLSRRMVQPLVAMKNSAAAMAAGNYTRKLEVDGEDEIADLSRSLNSLGSDLSDFVKKTQHMEKLRRDFVANVSHELRTPITIIRGYNEAISDGTVTDPDTISKYRNLITNETLRLEKLVKEMLDMSRLQRTDQAELEDVPLGHIAENVAEMLSVRAKEQGVNVTCDADDSVVVKGSGDRLVQLCMIFGDNALKHSPMGGTVHYSVHYNSAGEAVLTVTDQGDGIPTADIPYIWERFYKVDKSHSRNTSGMGLGLSLAKEIIRIHEATAHVHSKVGEGTSFEIVFPRRFAE